MRPYPFHEYWVELADLNHLNDTHRADVQFDGSFQLRDIRSGTYTLRVTTLNGELVHQELVTVAPQTGPLTVRLPASAKSRSAPGTISVTQLRHPPAHKAFQALLRRSDSPNPARPKRPSKNSKKPSASRPSMRMPTTTSPCSICGWAALKRPRAELTRAHRHRRAQRDRNSATWPTRNASSTVSRKRIASARAALRLDSGSPQAHLILGSILAVDPRTRAEAITHLERAAETLPSARATLETGPRRAR